MFGHGDQVFFVSFPYSDTLFKFDGSTTIPQYIVMVKNLIPSGVPKGGVSFSFLYSGAAGTIIAKYESQVLMTESGRTIDSYIAAYLFLNKNAKIQLIRSLMIDPIVLSLDMDDYLRKIREDNTLKLLPTSSGSWGHIAVEATEMIKFIGQALKNNQLLDYQRKKLVEISTEVVEGSNPILIIGRVK